jgi:hypothetical protein
MPRAAVWTSAESVRYWAVAFGTLNALLVALAALQVAFIGSFTWENRDNASDDWLVPLAFALFMSALTVFGGVVTARLWLVVAALVVQAVLGLIALDHALTEWSDHGDGWLIVFAVAIGATGALAVVLTRRSSYRPDGR